TLRRVAVTSMSSKSVSFNRDMLAEISVKAIQAVAEKHEKGYTVDLDDIQVVKKQGGSITDSQLIEGVIVDKEKVHTGMPQRVASPKIALLDAALEIKKTEIDAKIEISEPSQLNAFLQEEENMLHRMVEQVKKSGANVVFCQKGIDDLAQHFLAKEGIYAVRRVKKSDMEKLAKATGASIVSKVSELAPEDVGAAGLVEERKIGEDSLTFVTGCKNAKAVSVLLRGGTEHVLDEIERSIDDALNVVAVAVEDGKIVYGGGASAEEIALHLRGEAAKVGGREQMAFETFAEALETVPRTLAENAGLDPIDILIELRQSHKSGKKFSGVNVHSGKVDDMKALHVVEPIRVGRQAIESATDAAVMILRIDDVIASKSGGPPAGGGGPGGPGGMGGGDFGED
ncbi:MAG TPA: thermosome subunit beta, partial [Thermoplasmata archaeon]|nr:thermosome subunit beta [Thermoplasmata archaeon]